MVQEGQPINAPSPLLSSTLQHMLVGPPYTASKTYCPVDHTNRQHKTCYETVGTCYTLLNNGFQDEELRTGKTTSSEKSLPERSNHVQKGRCQTYLQVEIPKTRSIHGCFQSRLEPHLLTRTCIQLCKELWIFTNHLMHMLENRQFLSFPETWLSTECRLELYQIQSAECKPYRCLYSLQSWW